MEASRACGRAALRGGADYQGKLSAPLLGRIDLCIDVPPVTAADLALPPPAEGSAAIAQRVAAARAVQRERPAELDRKGKLPAIEAEPAAGLLADRARNWSKPRCNADTDGAIWPPSPSPTPKAAPCWPAAPSGWASRHAPGTAPCASRAPWPISTALTVSAACTSPRP